MDGLWVKLEPSEADKVLLEQSRLRVARATSGALSIASQRGAKTPARVKGLATRSLAGLPPDLREGVATEVAQEVAGRNRGVDGGSVLGVRCWSLRNDYRTVSVLTAFDKRVHVRLATQVPVAHRHPPGLVAYLARKGRSLYLVLPDPVQSRATATPTAVGGGGAAAVGRGGPERLYPRCDKCGGYSVGRVDPAEYGGFEWACERCFDLTTVTYRAPDTD